jgi:putative ABC transport system permease protein
VAAVDPGLLRTVGGSLASGAFLNPATDHFPAVVLGWSAAQGRGISDLRLPTQVDVAGTYFTVVGVLRPVPLVPEIDNSVLIGFPAATAVFGYAGGPTEIYLRSFPSQVTAVQSVLASTVNPVQPAAVRVSRPSDLLVAHAAAQSTFRLPVLGLGLGAVAVAIGAVGVANVMGDLSAGAARRDSAEPGARRLQRPGWVAVRDRGGTTGRIRRDSRNAASHRGHRRLRHRDRAAVRDPGLVMWAGLADSVAVGALAGLYPALRAARLAPAVVLRAL